MRLQHLYSIGIVLCTLLVGVLGQKPVLAQEQAVEPSSGILGTVFAFFATGFAPGEMVSYWATDPDGRVYEGDQVKATFSTRADWYWQAPSSGKAGYWVMVARGTASQVERVIFFELQATEGNIPASTAAQQCHETYDTAVNPSEGAPGTEFDFFARGFRAYERVVFWIMSPGGFMQQVGDFGTNTYGRVDWSWEAPPNAMPGTWVLIARGDVSHIEHTICFKICPCTTYPEKASPIDMYDYAVNPEQGPPGTEFWLFMSNFIEGEPVTYQLIDPYGQVYLSGESHANQYGRADWRWKSPVGARTGVWTWVARGGWVARNSAGGLDRTLSFVITEPTYESAVFPSEGIPGTKVAFFATGFKRREPVDYWFIGPDGHKYVFDKQSTRANPHGRTDWEWETSPGVAIGVWKTVAKGRDSGIERVLTLTIVPPCGDKCTSN